MASSPDNNLPIRLQEIPTIQYELPFPVLAALEHARDPGADPGLLVLAHALEEELSQRAQAETEGPCLDY